MLVSHPHARRLLLAASICFVASARPGWSQTASPGGALVPVSAVVSTAPAEEEGGTSASATTNDSGPAGIIPYTKGFNASLGTSSQHDSSNGWSSVLNPNLAYRLNRYFSADVGAPVYMYISIYQNIGTAAKPVYAYKPEKGVVGDTSLAVHADADFWGLDYNATVSLGLPSGNTDYGLGAGQPTYNLNNHFEKSLGIFTPDVELGFGDASSLVNQRVLKSYITVGSTAHFQAGTTVDLPHEMSFSANAYEELPLTKDTTYSTTGKGKKAKTTATTVGPSEDNGFITSLDIPLNRHVILSGFYNRSLIQHDDVAGFSFTFLLKGRPMAPGVIR